MISSFLRKQLAICFAWYSYTDYITRSQLGIKSSGRDAFSCWATSRGASATRAEAKRALSLSLSLTLGLAMATWEQWWTGGSKGRHSLSTSKGGQTSTCLSTKQHLHKICFHFPTKLVSLSTCGKYVPCKKSEEILERKIDVNDAEDQTK